MYGDAASSAITVLEGVGTLGAAVTALREAPASARVLTQEPVTIPPTVVGAYVRTAGSRNDPPVSSWIRALEDPRGEVVVVARTGTKLIASDWGRALLDDLVEEPPDVRAEGWTVRLADLRDVLPNLLKAGPVVVLDPTSAREPRILERSTGSDSVSPGSVLVVEPVGLGAALGIPDAGCDLSDRVVLPGATIAQAAEALGTDRTARGTTVLTDLGAEVDDASVEEAEDLLLELVESLRDEVDGVLTADLLGSESVHPWLRLRRASPAAESVERAVALEAHSDDVARLAERWARVLGLPAGVVEDIRLAGYWHDAGKGASEPFQAALRMSEGADGWLVPGPACDAIPLAKSALPRRLHRRSQALAGVPSGWRHEALSAELLDEAIAGGVVVPHDAELVRHLVLSHHGHFRGAGPVLATPTKAVPCAYQDPQDPRWLDRPRTFRDLNDRYGIYGLALMEAVVRLSDWEASRKEQLDD